MIFSQRLKGLLSETKTTWKEVSMTLDIGKNQQKYWEDKDIAPDGKTLCKLCEYFHVTSDYLLGLSDSKTPQGNNLTEEERLLLEAYRSASTQGRFHIIQVCMNEKTAAPKGEVVAG